MQQFLRKPLNSLIFTLTTLVWASASVFALDLTYSTQKFGSEQLVVTVSGADTKNLTTSFSHDGTSLRISGVDVRFLPEQKVNFSDLLAGISQVRRGLYTDLLVSLSKPSQLSATPGKDSLKLFIKSREHAANLPGSEEKDPSSSPLPSTSGNPQGTSTPPLSCSEPCAKEISLLRTQNAELGKLVAQLKKELENKAKSTPSAGQAR